MFAEVRALDRRVWSLALARLVVTAGFSMVLPLLAIHLAIDRGVPAVGFIWTIAGAFGALMQWVAGELVDRIGRKRVLVAALVVRAVNLAALGWAIEARAAVPVIAALVVLNSGLRAFFDPVASALVADLSAPEQRVAAFSLQREGINIGWAIGNASAALTAFISYGTLFYISAPLTLLATLALVGVPETPLAIKRTSFRLREALTFLQHRPFVIFLVATVALFTLQVQLYQTLSIYAARVLGIDRSGVHLLYTLNGLLVVVLQIPAVKHIRRLGTRNALFLGGLGYAASYAAVGLASGFVSLLLCVAAITLAEIVTAPAQQTAVTTMCPAGRIGAYSGLYGSAQIVGQSIGPLVGTAALDTLPARLAWFLLAILGVAAAFAYRRAFVASSQENLMARPGKP